MVLEFTHPELGQEVQSFAGYYLPLEEHVLTYKGREVLYILGHVCVEASCCGTGSWNYIQVPGFLLRKHQRGGGATPPVSEIEIIAGEEDRKGIRHFLAEKYPSAQIEIW